MSYFHLNISYTLYNTFGDDVHIVKGVWLLRRPIPFWISLMVSPPGASISANNYCIALVMVGVVST